MEEQAGDGGDGGDGGVGGARTVVIGVGGGALAMTLEAADVPAEAGCPSVAGKEVAAPAEAV